jgi:hypothetical protein
MSTPVPPAGPVQPTDTPVLDASLDLLNLRLAACLDALADLAEFPREVTR